TSKHSARRCRAESSRQDLGPWSELPQRWSQIIPLRRPATDVPGDAVVVNEPARQTVLPEPVERPLTADDRCRRCDVRVETRRGGDADRPPRPGRGAAGGWIEKMVNRVLAPVPVAR